MSHELLLVLVFVYFLLLLGVAWYTSRNSDNETFFIGNKSSNWMLVAFGMIGTSLSGVTFISVPGTVGTTGFGYFQVVLGYYLGYFAVAFILLPLYYRLNLTSIYDYLNSRFGMHAYKTGALFFIVSRTMGATLRLYLVINVIQLFILDALHVPFPVTAFVILLMIVLYTFNGGVKTIVWTDTLQTFFMLTALLVCTWYILDTLNLGVGEAFQTMRAKGFTRIFNTDPLSGGYFMKAMLGGAFVTISMTGLDQEMMQKNISVNRLADSQKNMISFSTVMVLINLLFLFLGGLLYLFAESKGLTAGKDELFPRVAMEFLPASIGIIFIIGLISALFPSADGAITALTSSFCIDILGLRRNKSLSEATQARQRKTVHLSFSALFFLLILYFKLLNKPSIIETLLEIAGYTYGPLLGLFAFGILTRRTATGFAVPVVCLVAPALCYLLKLNSGDWLGAYKIGIEMLIINGAVTFGGLYLLGSKPFKNLFQK